MKDFIAGISAASSARSVTKSLEWNYRAEEAAEIQAKDFIEKHDLLHSSQYGFHQADSTQKAILDIVKSIQINMDKNICFCGDFIDFKKAFDTFNHNILLDILNYRGFLGIIIRTQTIVINCFRI